MEYTLGQKFECRIEQPEPGGYRVTLLGADVQGFLPSDAKLAIGETVFGYFVGLLGHNHVLLSARSDEESHREPVAVTHKSTLKQTRVDAQLQELYSLPPADKKQN